MDTPQKRQTLLIILLVAFIFGVSAGFFPEGTDGGRAWNLFFGLVLLVPLMRWFALDARLHNYRISGPMFLCLVALMAFTVPFYFFATRRFGFWKSLLKSAAFFLVFCLVGGVGSVIMETIMATRR